MSTTFFVITPTAGANRNIFFLGVDKSIRAYGTEPDKTGVQRKVFLLLFPGEYPDRKDGSQEERSIKRHGKGKVNVYHLLKLTVLFQRSARNQGHNPSVERQDNG